MKAHVGVDSKMKIIHTAVVTAANVPDAAVLPDLLHGDETRVWGNGTERGELANNFSEQHCDAMYGRPP
jgi:transposase, IS5 family